MSHLDNLLLVVPDLPSRRILDVGAGRGEFLIDAVKRRYRAEGIEYNPRYIEQAEEQARRAGVSIQIRRGVGEALPFQNGSFDFINMAEVIEHVFDPQKVLGEVARVLSEHGLAYVSVPNRYGIYDPHFHVLFVNWLPRRLSDLFLRLVGGHKDYSHSDAGHQRLSDMHYMTRSQFEKLCDTHSLVFFDSREQKIKKRFPRFEAPLSRLYRMYAFLFISTYHGLIRKTP